MKTTIFDLRKELSGKYKDMEIYKAVSANQINDYQTDNLEPMENDEVEWDIPVEVAYYTMMDEEEYNSTILANNSETVDFDDLYDSKKFNRVVISSDYKFCEARILIIVLDHFYEERLEEYLDTYINEKVNYFNMRQICDLAKINYDTFRGYKNKGDSFSTDKKIKIVRAMRKAAE